jgi:FtsH-binding integral membrane protein
MTDSPTAGHGTARGLAGEVVTAAARRTALIWLLLRLLLAAVLLPVGSSPLGGWKHSIVLVLVTTGLVLYDARRLNERVFAENLGLSERAIASVSLLSAVVLEILLQLARPFLSGA